MPRSTRLPKVAFFCMEYGLNSALQTYCGGLGILAGDYLKAARDARLPVVGVGIRWKQGYGRQTIGRDGCCYHAHRSPAPGSAPAPGLKPTGITVTVLIRQRPVYCKVWQTTAFGNAPLYLLDTDIPGNADADNWITGQLYGWFGEERIAQEMVLGIGGVRALQALGHKVDVYHFNEGHAAFAGLELIRQAMESGRSFHDAWHQVRQRIVFTTHTPVEAGNETHPLDRLLYMGAAGGLTIEQLSAFGGAPFNMTAAGLRLARNANAVAELHARTANKMWAHLTGRAPIIAITNGVHVGTWVDPAIAKAARSGGAGAPAPGTLWAAHEANKRKLIAFVRERTGAVLDPEVLTIGFARRIVDYKRNDMILRDKQHIEPLLKAGKLQVIFAGKSHPLDDGAGLTVERIVAQARKFPRAVVFLEDYDMEIGRLLTRGVDVWLNNPRRPNEACGTSGMKAAMNGVLNLSTLDGWWPEACRDGKNGWQFGDGFESPDTRRHDAHDAAALARVLCDKVLPTYYQHRARWIKMMQASIAATRDRFSAGQMIAHYYARLYRPAAAPTATA
jgi:starch phosphorylase